MTAHPLLPCEEEGRLSDAGPTLRESSCGTTSGAPRTATSKCSTTWNPVRTTSDSGIISDAAVPAIARIR